jgi:hypothetical protein
VSSLGTVPALEAQQPADTAGPRRPERLFRSTEPVRMWLQSDFKTVFKDRDSMSTKRFPATMRWLGNKSDTLSTGVQLATRGHYRLRTCSVLPLKVYFDREKTRGSEFGGQGSVKLTSHCQKGEQYGQNLYIEYAVYGMYNALTPISLKARLSTITWEDPKDPGFTVSRPGFWTEEDDDMAQRNRGKVLMQTGGNAAEMDPWQMAVTDVFQYMIGNTDFSLYALHNIRIIQTDTSINYFPMAYDFDWSGLVNAPYARPDYRLPIKRVIDRLYRGGCHPPELLARVFTHFKAKKKEIYGVLDIEGLSVSRKKEATDYLDEFYKFVDDAGAVRREMGRVCDRL